MDIKKVAVIGAGTMGSSIALAIAKGNLPVILKDVDQAAVDAGLARIERMLSSLVRKGPGKGLSEAEAQASRALIQSSVNASTFLMFSWPLKWCRRNWQLKKQFCVSLMHLLTGSP